MTIGKVYLGVSHTLLNSKIISFWMKTWILHVSVMPSYTFNQQTFEVLENTMTIGKVYLGVTRLFPNSKIISFWMKSWIIHVNVMPFYTFNQPNF